MFWMMDARRIPGWGILENAVDGLPQLDELETMAKPGMMKRYLEDLMPYLKSFVLRIVIAVGGLCMMFPGTVSDVIGLVALVGVVVFQRIGAKNNAVVG